MRQKCKNCTHFAISVTHVWYDCFTREQHRDYYYNCCCFNYITIDNKRINQFNNCKRYKEVDKK